MRFDVAIWKSSDSSFAEIQTWVEAADPVTAVLSVMARLGLGSASTVFVSHEYAIVGQFVEMEVSGPSSLADCVVSYDYSLP